MRAQALKPLHLTGARGERCLEDDPGHTLGAGRRRERPRIDEARAVARQESGRIEMEFTVDPLAEALGKVEPRFREVRIVVAAAQKEHSHDRNAPFGVLMHEVYLDRVAVSVDLVFGRRVEVELHELELGAGDPEAAALPAVEAIVAAGVAHLDRDRTVVGVEVADATRFRIAQVDGGLPLTGPCQRADVTPVCRSGAAFVAPTGNQSFSS